MQDGFFSILLADHNTDCARSSNALDAGGGAIVLHGRTAPINGQLGHSTDVNPDERQVA